MTSAVPTHADAETISDEALLRRYAERHDPAAFSELANRRAGLVFGVCLRITADRHDAEELTQDCLLQLARKASTIQTSVAGWLHQVATHRALNAVRSRGRRRAREIRAATVESETTETAWSEVEPLLDEAVDGLPADVRVAIILHFLQSLSQEAVAQRLGVHQSTISRRIDRGLHLLRERLLASGVAMSAAPLSALLAAAASTPGAPNLAEAIGKIALAGAGSGGAGGLLGWLGLSWANVKAWVSLIGAAVFPVLVQLMAGGWHGFLAAVLITLYIAWKRPAWVEDLRFSSETRLYDDPFFPLRRWTWTTPPRNWRTQLFNALMASVTLGGAALIGVLADHPSPGMVAMFVFYSLITLSTAARIVIRVIRYGTGEAGEEPAETIEPPADLATVLQNSAILIAVPLMVAAVALARVRTGRPPAFTIASFIVFAITLVWGVADYSMRKLSRYRRFRRASLGDARKPSTEETKAPARPPKAAAVMLAFLLIGVVNFTTLILFATIANAGMGPTAARESAAMRGPLSTLCLLFLAASIRPLARFRGTTRPAVWLFAVAVAGLCAILNLGLCVVWLMPQG